MDCCQCQGIETEFNRKTAAKQLRRYRENGPAKTTLMLTNALTDEGVGGMTLLDIGGGIGAIQHELLKAGAKAATNAEASTAYIEAAKEEVERGMVVIKPGSVTPHKEFDCEVYILSKDEGGRHTPFFKGYRPQFYFRTTDVTGDIELPEGVEMVMPGDNTQFKVKLIVPVAMEQGLRFAIREGGRTVGAGVVSQIND